MVALGHLLEFRLHVVAQIVKAQFVVRRIGDVSGVGFALFGFVLTRVDNAGCQTQGAVDLAHPFGVTLGQIVVHGHDVDATACQRVQIGREGRHKGFTFTGLHFRDVALMQENPAHQLDIVGAQAQGAMSGFAAVGKRFGQQIIQGCAIGKTLLEFFGLCDQASVIKLLEVRLQRIDLLDQRARRLDFTVVRCSEHLAREFS